MATSGEHVHIFTTPVVKEVNVPRTPMDRDTFGDFEKEREKPKVNLWVRANLETYTEETLDLLAPQFMNEYVAIVDELALAGEALNNCLERYANAQKARDNFFKGRAY